MVSAPVRVFLACTGLGHERRGFETFTRDCAAALRGEASLALTVFAGGRGEHVAGERVIPNLPRGSRAAKALGALLGRDPYFVEQGSFFLGFVPALVTGAPDVVYFADLNLGNALWHWRGLTGARWRLLFYNGGNTTRPFTRCDQVQQVTPQAFDDALARGERADRMTVLPHGISIAPTFTPTDAAARARARAALDLPGDLSGAREIILSVAQLDRDFKRTDLLIEAVAQLPMPRPYLLLVGANGPDGDGLRALARARLGAGWSWRSEPHERMSLVYAAADRFTVLSRGEGFGLAHVEALAAGLPLLAHDDATTRFVVASAGLRRVITTIDEARAGLEDLLALPTDAASARARHESVRARFAWPLLRPHYVKLFHAVAAGAA